MPEVFTRPIPTNKPPIAPVVKPSRPITQSLEDIRQPVQGPSVSSDPLSAYNRAAKASMGRAIGKYSSVLASRGGFRGGTGSAGYGNILASFAEQVGAKAGEFTQQGEALRLQELGITTGAETAAKQRALELKLREMGIDAATAAQMSSQQFQTSQLETQLGSRAGLQTQALTAQSDLLAQEYGLQEEAKEYDWTKALELMNTQGTQGKRRITGGIPPPLKMYGDSR